MKSLDNSNQKNLDFDLNKNLDKSLDKNLNKDFNLNGIINIFKEKGYTSRDVVNIVSKKLGGIKAGHAGTLDPAARGVLILCLGNATKIAEYITPGVKEYVAEIVLGIVTDTCDATGNVLERAEPFWNESVLNSFRGKILQVPPMYSAIKQGGQRLYDLARRGIEVERAPREVEIFSLDVIGVEKNIVQIKVLCSKGTYIRSLCSDIGAALGCGAAMGELTRTRSGDFYAGDSVSIDIIKNIDTNLNKTNLIDTNLIDTNLIDINLINTKIISRIIPIENALGFKKINLPERFDKLLANGAKINLDDGVKYNFEGENVLVFSSGGKLGGIYKASGALLTPAKIFKI